MEIQKDLFQHIDLLPVRAQKVLKKFEEYSDLTYKQCENLLKQMEYVGYTFDYYLDAVPYDLRPIENRIILIGKFQGVISYSRKATDQFVSFEVSVVQNSLNKYGIEEEQISRFRVVSFGEEARFVEEKISVGQEIKIVGKLVNNSYLNSANNEVLTTLIESSTIVLLN
jgi:hypothetical protein